MIWPRIEYSILHIQSTCGRSDKSRLLNEISNLSVHPYCNEEAPEFIEAPTIESKQLEEFPELKPFPPEPFPWQALTDSQILENMNSDANEFGYAVGQCFQWNEMGIGKVR